MQLTEIFADCSAVVRLSLSEDLVAGMSELDAKLRKHCHLLNHDAQQQMNLEVS
jgi:hypothetical protein